MPLAVEDAIDADVSDGTDLSTTEGDGGARCLGTSLRESESNNDATSADKVPAETNTFCGRLEPGDVDFVTFTMPDDVGFFSFGVDSASGGRVKIEPSVDGEPFSLNGRWPFEPGKPYVVKLTSSSSQVVDYRLSFEFEQ